ncbi:rhombosortase [Microbulbifer pacificus]|uniref:rhombosortase n=1 Tax=Microbulbifer pacificus TaxID=407164 RepID=UPI001319EF48|nr:rhombosortase [Microbulbifer pacificus]
MPAPFLHIGRVLLRQQGLGGPLLLFAAVLGCWLMAPVLTPLLEYDHRAIAGGEFWRLVSGHLPHTNLQHLLLNGAGLLLLWILHGPHYRVGRFVVTTAAVALGTGLGLLLFSPQTDVYVGLSGVLHGLIIWGGCLDIRARWRTGYLLVAGTWIKVGWEQLYGASDATAQMINAAVAVDGHLWGSVAGTVLGLVALLYTTGPAKKSGDATVQPS